MEEIAYGRFKIMKAKPPLTMTIFFPSPVGAGFSRICTGHRYDGRVVASSLIQGINGFFEKNLPIINYRGIIYTTEYKI